MGNNIDKVCTGLYVGGLMGATKKEVLAECNVTHVLTLIEGAEPHFPDDFKYKQVNVADCASSNLYGLNSLLNVLNTYMIAEQMAEFAMSIGISRAITISTMYVMTASTLTYEEALTVLTYSRQVANPNFGFRMQLKKYQKEDLEKARASLKEKFPNSTLNDETELREKLAKAKEAFVKEGRPPLVAENEEYVDMPSLHK